MAFNRHLWRAAYVCLSFFLLPLAFLRLFFRARKNPAYLEHLGERLGFVPQSAKPVIWVHAVSVGETHAAAPLVRRLLARFPGCAFLFTHGTPTGREAGKKLFEDRILQAYLPFDVPFLTRLFFRRARPVLGIFMETEIWPNLVAEAKRRGIPLVLANARLSAASAKGYRKVYPLAEECFSSFFLILAQSREDARRLSFFSRSEIIVTGNLKFDRNPSLGDMALGRLFRDRFGKRLVVAAISTRQKEEALILDVMSKVNMAGVLWVIVPRHPERFGEVEDLLRAREVTFAKRSEEKEVSPEARVFLGDSMGEVLSYVFAADVVVVGGSLLPYGGQNPLEPMSLGKPVLFGPHMEHFAAIARAAKKSGAAEEAGDALALARAVDALLACPEMRRARGESAKAFFLAHAGASEKAEAALVRRLGQAVPPLRQDGFPSLGKTG